MEGRRNGRAVAQERLQSVDGIVCRDKVELGRGIGRVENHGRIVTLITLREGQ